MKAIFLFLCFQLLLLNQKDNTPLGVFTPENDNGINLILDVNLAEISIYDATEVEDIVEIEVLFEGDSFILGDTLVLQNIKNCYKFLIVTDEELIVLSRLNETIEKGTIFRCKIKKDSKNRILYIGNWVNGRKEGNWIYFRKNGEKKVVNYKKGIISDTL